jgi:hypothetical protein
MKRIILKSLLIALTLSSSFSSCKKEKDKADNPNNNNNNNVVDTNPTELPCYYFTESRTLSNDTNKQVDYLINCVADISSDVVINPGVVVAFGPNAGLRILPGGSLRCLGSETNKVTLTGKIKVKGYWKGIRVDSNSPLTELSHTIVEFAGGEAFSGKKGAIVTWAGSRIKINNSWIKDNDAAGLNIPFSSETNVTLGGNKFSGNSDVPLEINSAHINVPHPTDDYTGNSSNFIRCINYTSQIKTTMMWRKINVPYLVTGAASLAVMDNAMLGIEAGTTILFDSNTEIKVNNGCALKAIGTPDQPILMRGLVDQPGAWKGLYFGFTNNLNNQLQHVQIQNAGQSVQGAVYMWASPNLNLDNVHFKKIASCAIYGAPGSGSPNVNLSTSNLTYEDVGGEICGD